MKTWYLIMEIQEIPEGEPELIDGYAYHNYRSVSTPVNLFDPEEDSCLSAEIAAETLAVLHAEESGRPAFVQKVYSKSKPSF